MAQGTGNSITKKDGKFSFQISMEKPEQITDAFIHLCTFVLAECLPLYSLWNTPGSEHMKPALWFYEDLPPKNAFSELLAGQRLPDTAPIDTVPSFDLPATDGQESINVRMQNGTLRSSRIDWRSSAHSTIGKKRKINEDALLERPEIGLWAVADGMGGHRSGDVASSAVVEALGTLSAIENLETLIGNVIECLHGVNTDLITMADTLGPGQIIGTTVVVMLSVGERCASIWAGDSRLYCLRDGDLSQLTHDHSLAAKLSHQEISAPNDLANTVYDNIITRALGAEPELRVDTITFEAKRGDIYLLCSDGLTRELTSREIADILGRGGCDESSQRLIDLALERGARDNVTVIVVQAGEA
jgi:type VI secretion system protein ImpM